LFIILPPFFEFDIRLIKNDEIEQLKKFHKNNFDVESILNNANNPTNLRTASSGIGPGGLPMPPEWSLLKGNGAAPGSVEPTYVPTRLQIQINAIPIVSRQDISQNFSLRDYASGELLKGSQRGDQGGGIW
jgi:hypothetical protein